MWIILHTYIRTYAQSIIWITGTDWSLIVQCQRTIISCLFCSFYCTRPQVLMQFNCSVYGPGHGVDGTVGNIVRILYHAHTHTHRHTERIERTLRLSPRGPFPRFLAILHVLSACPSCAPRSLAAWPATVLGRHEGIGKHRAGSALLGVEDLYGNLSAVLSDN